MERLTFEGNFCDIAQCYHLPCPHGGSCTQKQVWERLKAYEDKADEIALKLMRLADLENICSYTRLRELAEADKDGRLVVLPCKVGDTLFRVFDGNISEHEVQNMKYFARQRRLGIDMTPFFPDAEKFIGKTVFLTREEAEKALRGWAEDER